MSCMTHSSGPQFKYQNTLLKKPNFRLVKYQIWQYWACLCGRQEEAWMELGSCPPRMPPSFHHSLPSLKQQLSFINQFLCFLWVLPSFAYMPSPWDRSLQTLIYNYTTFSPLVAYYFSSKINCISLAFLSIFNIIAFSFIWESSLWILFYWLY